MALEILVGPLEVYLAPVGTAFPDVDETPSGSWKLLGKNGKRNLAESGVTVASNQTIKEHRNAGSTGPLDAYRTDEGLEFSLTLEDMTAEAYAIALNNQTVTEVAAGSGTPGYKSIPLHQGTDVSKFALLAKGKSPYDASLKGQYQVPVCYQADNPAPVFNKSDVSALKLTFKALEDPNASSEAKRFGERVLQTAAAL
jgi:hypothetical protein